MNKKMFSSAVTNFLEKNNLNKLSVTPLKNDASKRRYYRFNNYKKNVLLMDSSLEKKTITNFVLVKFTKLTFNSKTLISIFVPFTFWIIMT